MTGMNSLAQTACWPTANMAAWLAACWRTSHVGTGRHTHQDGQRENVTPPLQAMAQQWLRDINTVMFKSLHGCAPSYLSDACKSASEASRRLRSSGAVTCVIPWSITRLGDRSFDVARPRLWNKLPASLWSSDSLCQFRKQLKTFLFVKD